MGECPCQPCLAAGNGGREASCSQGTRFSPSPSSSSSTKMEESLLSRVQAYLRSYIYAPEEGRLRAGAACALGCSSSSANRLLPRGEQMPFLAPSPKHLCRGSCRLPHVRRLGSVQTVAVWAGELDTPPLPWGHGWAEAEVQAQVVLILESDV